MKELELQGVVESLLFASGDNGVTIKQVANILDITNLYVEHLINELNKEYEATDRGISIIQANGVYHLSTKRIHSKYIKKLFESPPNTKLSQAALETLAIVAYQQPITRVEIEEIRGVNSDRPVQTLLARSLIEEVGKKDAVGKPILFGTTLEFLTFFGLVSLDELPPLPEVINTDEVEQEANLFFEEFNQ